MFSNHVVYYTIYRCIGKAFFQPKLVDIFFFIFPGNICCENALEVPRPRYF